MSKKPKKKPQPRQKKAKKQEYDDINLATKIKMSIWMGCVILLCVGMLLVGTEYTKVMHDFELPRFAKAVDTADDGGSGKYQGLFYAFDIEGNFMPEAEYPGVTKADFYLFGMKMNTAVRD